MKQSGGSAAGVLIGLVITVGCTGIAGVGCGGGGSAPASPTTPASTAPEAPAVPASRTVAERAQWYQDCWRHFNDKAWDQFGPCYAEQAISEAVDSNPSRIIGRAAIVSQSRRSTAAWPDVRGELQLVLQRGVQGASVALWHGTHTAPLENADGTSIPATNKPFGFLIAHAVTTDEAGRYAVRDASYVDEGVLLAQLGITQARVRPVMAGAPASPTVVIAKNDAAEAKNVAAIEAMFAAYNRRDVRTMDAAADSYVLHEVARPADLNKQAATASMREMFAAFPDGRVTASELWGAGDYVVAQGTFTGTQTGELPSMGLAATGRKVQAKFLEIFRLQNGVIVEDWLFYNSASYLAQLGVR